MKFETRGLRVRYPKSDRPALDGVDMRAEAGELYAVLGPNGSGKSTLMKALLGVIGAEGGEALLDDRPARDWPRRELARQVGAVAQSEPMPFPLTGRELVSMGRYPHLGSLQGERPADREAVQHALERCDVVHLAHRPVDTLSGGELQRMRIARAFAQQPRALVLDEPTASLDVRHEMTILELLRSSADEGITVLLVTHHLDLAARFADRLLLLDGGRVAAEGGASDVFREEILERVYRWPVSIAADPSTGSPRITPLRASDRPGPS